MTVENIFAKSRLSIDGFLLSACQGGIFPGSFLDGEEFYLGNLACYML